MDDWIGQKLRQSFMKLQVLSYTDLFKGKNKWVDELKKKIPTN